MTAQQFLVAAVPIFLAAVLGVATGFFTDWLKTRREYRKLSRERQEKELTQLNVATSAMGYNIELLLHISHAAGIAASGAKSCCRCRTMCGKESTRRNVRAFVKSMHSKFTAMMTRCPEPHFVELEFFKEIPFVLAKDPELLKVSGWVMSYTRALRDILSERNKRIDMATSASTTEGRDVDALEEQIRVQVHIGNIEVINSAMLFQQFKAVCKKLEKIAGNYKNVSGAHLKLVPPAPLEEVLKELTRIAKEVNPEFPHSEQSQFE